MKLKSLVKYVGLASLALGANASFASLTFDADGAGGDAAVSVDSFDWTTTSFLAVGGTTAIENWVSSGGTCPDGSCQFNVYTHALLLGTTLTGGTVTTPSGLNVDYQITMTLQFTEVVTGVTSIGGQAIATFDVVPSVASFQIFYDTDLNANNLTGQGFNDGTLIADSTTISNSSGGFNVLINSAPEALDQAGADDYPGTLTVVGSGNQGAITMGDFTLDPSFFLTDIADFTFLFNNISQQLPYDSVDPSGCFSGTPSAVAVGSATGGSEPCDGTWSNNWTHVDPNGGLTPNIGTINGLSASDLGGPDFIAQTDFNSPVNGTVPVPAPLALLGAGLLGLGWSRRNKR